MRAFVIKIVCKQREDYSVNADSALFINIVRVTHTHTHTHSLTGRLTTENPQQRLAEILLNNQFGEPNAGHCVRTNAVLADNRSLGLSKKWIPFSFSLATTFSTIDTIQCHRINANE